MGDGNLACTQHLGHGRDMAKAHIARRREGHDCAHARTLPLGVTTVSQTPPRPCVAANLYPRELAGKGGALPIGLLGRRWNRGEQRDGEQKESRKAQSNEPG